MMDEYNDLYISPFFYKLMSLKKDFMYIPSTDAVFIGEEWDKWNIRHEIDDPVTYQTLPRFFFKYITDKNGRTGYAVNRLKAGGYPAISTLMIPFEIIRMSA